MTLGIYKWKLFFNSNNPTGVGILLYLIIRHGGWNFGTVFNTKSVQFLEIC